MRKKDILGSFVRKPNVLYTHAIKKLPGEAEEYVALIEFLPDCRELYVDDGGKQVCLAAPGYKWLAYLPLHEKWCVEAFYTPENELIDWYFDISKGNFLDENGMPCTDDIFLDLVIHPDGHTLTLDADELQEALGKEEITLDDFYYAYAVREEILRSQWSDVGFLTRLSNRLLSDFGQ